MVWIDAKNTKDTCKIMIVDKTNEQHTISNHLIRGLMNCVAHEPRWYASSAFEQGPN